MLPGVMSGSLYSRIVAVHDAIARSGGLPVMDRFFVPNDPTFQYHVYEARLPLPVPEARACSSARVPGVRS